MHWRYPVALADCLPHRNVILLGSRVTDRDKESDGANHRFSVILILIHCQPAWIPGVRICPLNKNDCPTRHPRHLCLHIPGRPGRGSDTHICMCVRRRGSLYLFVVRVRHLEQPPVFIEGYPRWGIGIAPTPSKSFRVVVDECGALPTQYGFHSHTVYSAVTLPLSGSTK